MDESIESISNEVLELAPVIQKTIQTAFFREKSISVGKKDKKTSSKQLQDIVLDIDHKVGKLYISNIFKKYSNVLRIDSEEKGERIGRGKITLRLDPIDGSKHFFMGFPEVASTASLVFEGVVYFGLVINVLTGDIYYAERGKGAFLNNKKVNVNNKNIDDNFSFVNYEAPSSALLSKDLTKFNEFSILLADLTEKSYRTRNIGVGSTSICLVADGSSCAYVDLSGTTKIYDVEAAVLIAKEAGAVVGFINGEQIVKKFNTFGNKKYLKENLVVANKKAFSQISNLFIND